MVTMLLNPFRIAMSFVLSSLCTWALGEQLLFPLVGSLGLLCAIPYGLLGILVGFCCGMAIPKGCVRAMQWGGVAGSIAALIAPIIVSYGIPLITLWPFFLAYSFLLGAAARSGAKLRLRRP